MNALPLPTTANSNAKTSLDPSCVSAPKATPKWAHPTTAETSTNASPPQVYAKTATVSTWKARIDAIALKVSNLAQIERLVLVRQWFFCDSNFNWEL